jgi:hypothetical protein
MVLRTCLALASLVSVAVAQVDFSVSFVSGQNRFRVGEIIEVELAFSSPATETYVMGTRRYDRSGRLTIERYEAAPPGRDPMREFFSASSGFLGGGLSSGPLMLGPEPQTLRFDLNDFLVFDEPGRYQLRITSQRIARAQPGSPQGEPLTLESNPLEIEIFADPAWQLDTGARAAQTLDSPDASPEEKRQALRRLRFLDTPAAVQEIVRRLGQPEFGDCWDCMVALTGTRHRELAAALLEAGITAPEVGVSGHYLRALQVVSQSLGELPPYPRDDAAAQQRWSALRGERDRQQRELMDELFRRAAAALPAKQGAARAATVRALLGRPVRDTAELRQPLREIPGQMLAEAFLDLPEQQQWPMLMGQWGRLRVPAMATALRQLIERPQLKEPQLRELALRRLYDLDPAAGERYILAEIRRPHNDLGGSQVNIRTLGMLSGGQRPELDELLAERIENVTGLTRGLDAQLIARYASAAIAPRVRAAYEFGPSQECRFLDGMLGYFSRVDPAYAVAMLSSGIGASLCMDNGFRELHARGLWAEAEPAIIKKLDRPQQHEVRSAAEVLSRFGSERARRALFERQRALHRRWKEHEGEFTLLPNTAAEVREAVYLQHGLIAALTSATGWILDDDQVQELEEMLLGPNERRNLQQWRARRDERPVPVHLVAPDGLVRIQIGPFPVVGVDAARRKLAQFPPGTQFRVGPTSEPEADEALSQLAEAAVDLGHLLDRPQ